MPVSRVSRPTRPSRPSSGKKLDLDTSAGLYQVAKNNNLQPEAAKVLSQHEGEETQRIFSGGFISDVFDVLNLAQYGVVGILKGKSFAEGVKTRQSFSDKDALGDEGIPGIIAGIALDIAVDPLTYIAPWTILKKIPGVVKGVKLAKAAAFGKKVLKPIEGGVDVGKKLTRLQEVREGGNVAGRYMAEKFSYMFGVDPVYKFLAEKRSTAIGASMQNVMGILKTVAKFDPETAAKLITRKPDGTIVRVGVKQLQKTLSPEEFETVNKVWANLDNLGKEAVKEGILTKAKFEENFGVYLKNAFEEYEKKGLKSFFGIKKPGAAIIKSKRTPEEWAKGFLNDMGADEAKKLYPKAVDELGKINLKGLSTDEIEKISSKAKKSFGQIDNPTWLLYKSTLDLLTAVEDAKFFRGVNKSLGTDTAQEGFTQLGLAKRFDTNIAKKIETLSDIKEINKSLKLPFKNLKATFKASKALSTEASKVEREIAKFSEKTSDELSKLLSTNEKLIREISSQRKLGVIPEQLQLIGEKIKKFDNLEDLSKSKEGIELEKLFINGDLERGGYKSIQEFFDAVKKPFKPATETKTKEFLSIEGRISNLDKKLKRISGKKLNSAKKAEQLRMQQALRKAVKKLNKLKKEAQEKVAKTTDISPNTQLVKMQELVKAPKLGKEAFKEMERLKNKLLKATTRLGKLKESEFNRLEKTLKDFEDKLLKEQGMKVQSLQKKTEALTRKSKTLSEIDRRSINDAFVNWEKQISDLRFGKEKLIGKLEDLRLSSLGGKYVPNNVHKMITDIIRPDPSTIGKKAVAGFKYSKVILNPATHVRNVLSNMTLNWWKLGIGVWRIDLYAEAVKNATKGGKWVDELRKAKVGYNVNTLRANEFPHILGMAEQFSTRTNNIIKKSLRKMGDLYQGEENVAKLAAYIHHRKKGIGITEAWKAAESATFNYAQVTPFVRKLRTSVWGMPFITFGLKAAPIAAGTALKHPARISVIGKIKKGIENLSDIEETDRERATEAPWIKDGFYIKLPMKDKEGRSAYFDLTYIIPFGDLVSGQFIERQISKDTGLVEGVPLAALSKAPVFNLIKELSRNQDFSGRRIWRESDSQKRQLADIMRHLTKTYMPPLVSDQLPGGYNDQGERKYSGFAKAIKEDKTGTQNRTLMQELLKVVGMKVQPIDIDIQESMNEWNKKKGLRTLLQDRNVVNDFSISYIPKKK